ncbi:hypothetical protein D9M72_624760 [compost metagenome]
MASQENRGHVEQGKGNRVETGASGLRHGAGAVAGARCGAKQVRGLLPANSIARSAAQRRCPVSRHAAVVEMELAIQSYRWRNDASTP